VEVVGWIAIAVVAATAITGLVVGVRSVPDIKRYLKMRQM
jgi:hypothetical protein